MIKEYLKPSSVEEVTSLREKNKKSSGWFGNGTFINNSYHDLNYETVIDISRLELIQIEETAQDIQVGASVTLQNLIDSALIPAIVKEAAHHEASRNTRNMKTLGGDIGIRGIFSNMIPVLVALKASVQTPDATCLLEDYLSKNYDDLILKIILPKKETNCHIKKISLQSNSPTIFTTAVSLEKIGTSINEIIIAVGGIETKGVRLSSLETMLLNGTINPDDSERIEEAVKKEVQAVWDINGSAEYKNHIAGVSVSDCLKRSLSGMEVKNEN
jgi:probable selenate reductase FAD-binding subunit